MWKATYEIISAKWILISSFVGSVVVEPELTGMSLSAIVAWLNELMRLLTCGSKVRSVRVWEAWRRTIITNERT
jgi:hypothetical protein